MRGHSPMGQTARVSSPRCTPGSPRFEGHRDLDSLLPFLAPGRGLQPESFCSWRASRSPERSCPTGSGRPGRPSVPLPLRDHTPHPAPGVFDVAGIPGDGVQVHHRLAGGRADVVAVGVEPAVKEGFRLPGEGEGGRSLRRRVEEAGDVAEGDFLNGLIISELSHLGSSTAPLQPTPSRSPCTLDTASTPAPPSGRSRTPAVSRAHAATPAPQTTGPAAGRVRSLWVTHVPQTFLWVIYCVL